MSIYINQIRSIARPNKYTKWYISIIETALTRFTYDYTTSLRKNRATAVSSMGYVEAHHIVPKSIDPSIKNNPDNHVFMTAREHYLVHWLATKMFDGKHKSKMAFAFYSMIIGNQHTKLERRVRTGQVYEIARKMLVGVSSYTDRDAANKKISAAKIGKPKTDAERENITEANRRRSNTKVLIDGVEYESLNAAAIAHGVAKATINYWHTSGRAIYTKKTTKKRETHAEGKSIKINGIVYNQYKEAAKSLGISVYRLNVAINSRGDYMSNLGIHTMELM